VSSVPFVEACCYGCKERGWLKARGQQRTDSTHVLAKIRSLNRVEGVGETFRAVLNSLAVVAPQWLSEQWQEEWIERYEHRVEDYRLPDGKQVREASGIIIGKDGAKLLAALYADPAPSGCARFLPSKRFDASGCRTFSGRKENCAGASFPMRPLPER